MENNSTESNVAVKLYTKNTNADGQKFQVIRTTDQYFKITPKTGEGADPDMVLAPKGGVINANLIMQKNLDSTNQKHEWFINNFYDAALLAVDLSDLIYTDSYLSNTTTTLNQLYTTRHVDSTFTSDQIR